MSPSRYPLMNVRTLHTPPSRAPHRRLVPLLGFAALALAGCAITPTPTTEAEVSKRVTDDRAKMFVDQEAVRGPMSYSEVAARALKYNQDFRLKAMEGALSQGQLDVARWDMFPRMLLNAGYVTRSPADGSRTQTVETGFESLFHQTSTERTRSIASAEFSWNVLDFGVSYYRARQQADQVMIAEERKRKVVQNILVDSRNAYWRALGAQRLSGRIDALLERSRKALDDARRIEQQGLMPQPQVLAYQRALLDAIVLLQYRRQELELAKQELAALMNLPPGTPFTLVDAEMVRLPAAPTNLAQLEEIALNRRPELREEDYRSRITASEVRRAIVSALPGLSIDVSGRYDSNRFLLDNSWVDGGLRLGMNLFRLASIPSLMRANEAQKQVDEARRMAQAMAIMTQVRVATLRFGLTVSEYEQVATSASVDERILGYARSAATARAEGELEVIRNEARALLSEYQRHIAYANAQAAWGRIYNSLGYDVDPPPPGAGVAEVASAIDRSLSQWQQSVFVPPAPRTENLPAVAVVLEHPVVAERAAIVQAVRLALGRNGLRTVDMPTEGPPTSDVMVLQVTPRMDDPKDGARRVTMAFAVLRADGRSGGEGRYTAMLPASPDIRALSALAEAAVDASVVSLNEWAQAHAAPGPRLAAAAHD
jgi:outer membrane protein TolC